MISSIAAAHRKIIVFFQTFFSLYFLQPDQVIILTFERPGSQARCLVVGAATCIELFRGSLWRHSERFVDW
jgi:hypothetical protein